MFEAVQLSFFPECATQLPDWMKSSLTTRIIGGQDAPLPIPWQAGLLFDNKLECSATIIDEETVLTTTPCVYSNLFSTPPVLQNTASLKIEAGVVSHGSSLETAQTIGISEIIVHPCARLERYLCNYLRLPCSFGILNA